MVYGSRFLGGGGTASGSALGGQPSLWVEGGAGVGFGATAAAGLGPHHGLVRPIERALAGHLGKRDPRGTGWRRQALPDRWSGGYPPGADRQGVTVVFLPRVLGAGGPECDTRPHGYAPGDAPRRVQANLGGTGPQDGQVVVLPCGGRGARSAPGRVDRARGHASVQEPEPGTLRAPPPSCPHERDRLGPPERPRPALGRK